MDDCNKNEFLLFVEQAFEGGTLVKVNLGKKRGGDVTLQRVFVTPTVIRGERQLSFLYRHDTKDITKNYALDDAVTELGLLCGSTFLSTYAAGEESALELVYSKKLKSRLIRPKRNITTKTASDAGHTRTKKRFISSENNNYLIELGVVNRDGSVARNKEKKFRQINKFIEVIDGVVRSSNLREKDEIHIVDMGAGKGYLTFALYDYCVNTLGKKVTVTGVEFRQDLVDLCNDIAKNVGFDGLHFVKGYITDYKLESVDMLIALHACNTATDDAIHQGIEAGAEVIVCSPCCHKEVAPQLKADGPNAAVIKFGIHRERMGTMVTDSIRALLMQYCGYKTNVFEFISTEHTGKNLMIAGVKRSDGREDKWRSEAEDLMTTWGIEQQHLYKLLTSN